jgi:hypothetical protein
MLVSVPVTRETLMFYQTFKFYAACSDRCGHHQVLKIMDKETAVFCIIA